MFRVWRKSGGGNRHCFEAFIYWMPNFLDTIPDNAFKAGLLALSLFYSLLIGPEVCDFDNGAFLELFYYFRRHVDKFIHKGVVLSPFWFLYTVYKQ